MAGHDDPVAQVWIGPGNGDGFFVPAHVQRYPIDGRAEIHAGPGEVWCLCSTTRAVAVNPDVPSSATQSMALHTMIERAEGSQTFGIHLQWRQPKHIADEVQDSDVGTLWRAPDEDAPHIRILGPFRFTVWGANTSDHPWFVYYSAIMSRLK